MVHSKNKGKAFELKVSHMIKDFGFAARRGQQFQGTPESPDIISELPFNFECKAVEKLNLWDAWEQAKSDSGASEMPAVVFKRNRSDILICMEFSDLLGIMVWIKEKGLMDEWRERIRGKGAKSIRGIEGETERVL